MKIFLYVTKEYLLRLFILSIIVTTLTILLDLAETLKSHYNKTVVEYLVITLAKSINTLVQISPILILVTTILTIHIFARRGELIAMESLGFARLQLIFYLLVSPCIFFLIHLLILEEILPKLQYASNKIITKNSEIFSFTNKGLFFKQENSEKLYFLLANQLHFNTLLKLEIWQLNKEFQLEKTFIAEEGLLLKEGLKLKHITSWSGNTHRKIDNFTIPGFIINKKLLQLQLNKVETIQLFQLPSFIQSASIHGFSTLFYEKYFYNNIYLILSFLTMFLLGFSGAYQKNPRDKNKIISVLLLGIAIFFLQDVITSIFINLGLSIQFSVVLARITALSIIVGKNVLSIRYRNQLR